MDVGVVEVYERDEAGNRRKVACEIDFVVNRSAKKYYIQSALSMSDPVKAKTELRPLLGTKDFFKKIVVSKSSMKPWTDEDGIVHLGLYDFLLNEDLKVAEKSGEKIITKKTQEKYNCRQRDKTLVGNIRRTE